MSRERRRGWWKVYRFAIENVCVSLTYHVAMVSNYETLYRMYLVRGASQGRGRVRGPISYEGVHEVDEQWRKSSMYLQCEYV